MFTVMDKLLDRSEPRLLRDTLVIYAVSLVSSLSICVRTISLEGNGQTGWGALTGFVTGCAIWATQLLSTLGDHADFPIAAASDRSPGRPSTIAKGRLSLA